MNAEHTEAIMIGGGWGHRDYFANVARVGAALTNNWNSSSHMYVASISLSRGSPIRSVPLLLSPCVPSRSQYRSTLDTLTGFSSWPLRGRHKQTRDGHEGHQMLYFAASGELVGCGPKGDVVFYTSEAAHLL